MSDMWDPYANVDWEALGDPNIDWELLGDPYLQPEFALPGDLSKYGDPEAYDIATIGRQLDNIKKLNAILRDPFFNYRVAIETGQDTFPFEQLMQPGNPWLQDPTGLGGSGRAADYNALINGGMGQMGGGGGYGGGDYGGGGYGGGGGLPPGSYLAEDGTMVVPTPLLSATLNSTDPVLAEAARLIDEGYDPATVSQTLYAKEADPELRKMYVDQVGKMFEERNTAQLAQQTPGAGGAGVGEPSELAKTAAKWGVADPMAQYGAVTGLPDEVELELNRYLGDEGWAQRAASGMTRQANRLERDAVYAPDNNWFLGQEPAPTKVVGPNFTTGGVEPAGLGPPPRRVPAEEADAAYYGTDLAAGLNPGRWYRGAARMEPTDTVLGTPAGGGGGGGRSGGWGGEAGGERANQRASLLNWLTPERREVSRSGQVVNRDGRRVRANAAGANAARKRARADYLRQNGAAEVQRYNDATRDYIGMYLQQQGRTPQRDAMAATMNYLRRAGLSI
jgi:hypothetical protein